MPELESDDQAAVTGRTLLQQHLTRLLKRYSDVVAAYALLMPSYRLCGNSQATQELLRSDDLMRLFDLLATPCPHHNQEWRLAASEALTSVYQSCLSSDVLQYIKAKGCLGRCLAALQQVGALPWLCLVFNVLRTRPNLLQLK